MFGEVTDLISDVRRCTVTEMSGVETEMSDVTQSRSIDIDFYNAYNTVLQFKHFYTTTAVTALLDNIIISHIIDVVYICMYVCMYVCMYICSTSKLWTGSLLYLTKHGSILP